MQLEKIRKDFMELLDNGVLEAHFNIYQATTLRCIINVLLNLIGAKTSSTRPRTTERQPFFHQATRAQA